VALASERRRWQSLLRGFAAVLVTIGAVGIIRTNMAMDGLAAADTALGSTRPLAPAQRFLPGVLANPARYVSAMNAAVEGVSGTTWADPLRTFALMDAKVAMDRCEALAGAGVSLALFASAIRAARHGEAGAIAFDLAPLVTVATVLFAALSFCELP
jgi:hypothetical protein